ncbi:MAG TPA: nuclear transport factor 2 family protein [Bryobacteraceae bacterium]|nr:nuclear transport factor 2 family protein [Bryobacteraceae bacterium]
MHANAILLDRLFSSLNNRDYEAMGRCYHDNASFRDIAFDLKGRQRIRSMWHMISQGDIRVTYEVVAADDHGGLVRLVAEYTFSDTGRRVRNPIESRFRFAEGKIVAQSDACDPRAWAAMALGGFAGYIAGRVRFFRSWKAHRKLRRFMQEHGSQGS